MFDKIHSALELQDLHPTPLAVLDILLLALIIYQLLKLIRGTRSVNMMIALVVLVLLHLLAGAAGLNAFHTVLGTVLTYVPIAVIVLFQNQIRRFLANLGRNPLVGFRRRRDDANLIEEVALAAASLASKRLGALIVIERDMGLRSFYETGILLDAEVSYDLLMNIFISRSPLHDGAAVIAEGRLKAASCYLPLTTNPTLSRTYGTRHRAAFGITEESDALAVVVSEERGVISLVEGGTIVENLDARGLMRALTAALTAGERMSRPRGPWVKSRSKGRAGRRAPAVSELGDV